MIRWFEHRQVYVPSAVHDGDAADLGRPFEEAFFSAGDGVRLHGWFFPADPRSARADQVILLLHGNAGNISHRLGFYQVWLETGVNVFAFDYRGYGRSEGRPSEEGTYLDAQAAYGWLRQKGFAPGNIIALGKSLGGGIASELTVRETLGGLVLQSTFTSIADVGSELFPWLPVRWANSIQYNTHSKLPGIKIPVLVMHSRDDRLIRYHHGQKNFAAANEPKMFCRPGALSRRAEPVFRESGRRFAGEVVRGPLTQLSQPVHSTDKSNRSNTRPNHSNAKPDSIARTTAAVIEASGTASTSPNT